MILFSLSDPIPLPFIPFDRSHTWYPFPIYLKPVSRVTENASRIVIWKAMAATHRRFGIICLFVHIDKVTAIR